MRLVFFGTPDFAVPSLRALLGEGFDIAAVVTQPDRPKGRSRSKVIPSPIKTAALEEGLTVLQPERPDSPEFLAELRKLKPDLGVVVGYGQLLKPSLMELHAKGLINVHASLLPHFRGAAPIEHAILEGEDETGVTIMKIVSELDAGPIILQVTTPIVPDETGGELTARLAELGALALVEALSLIAVDAATSVPQDDSRATYAPKLTRDVARIEWDKPAERVSRQVRALDPRIGAWTTLGGRVIKLFGPRPADEWEVDDKPGEIVEIDPALVVATGLGSLQFIDVQPAGRERMAAASWVRGKNAKKGDQFE